MVNKTFNKEVRKRFNVFVLENYKHDNDLFLFNFYTNDLFLRLKRKNEFFPFFDVSFYGVSQVSDFSFIDEAFYDFYPIIKHFFFKVLFNFVVVKDLNFNDFFFKHFKVSEKGIYKPLDKGFLFLYLLKRSKENGFYFVNNSYKGLTARRFFRTKVADRNDALKFNGLERLFSLVNNEFFLNYYGKKARYMFEEHDVQLYMDLDLSYFRKLVREKMNHTAAVNRIIDRGLDKSGNFFKGMVESSFYSENSGFNVFFEYLHNYHISLFPKKFSLLRDDILL